MKVQNPPASSLAIPHDKTSQVHDMHPQPCHGKTVPAPQMEVNHG